MDWLCVCSFVAGRRLGAQPVCVGVGAQHHQQPHWFSLAVLRWFGQRSLLLSSLCLRTTAWQLAQPHCLAALFRAHVRLAGAN